MEHRLNKRIPGKLGLLVYKRGLPVATGQIRDASTNGLLIATDFDDVQLNQTLEIEFRLPDKQDNCSRRLKAQVVRKGEGGIGVLFEGAENNDLSISMLLSWLERHHLNYRHFEPVRGQPKDADISSRRADAQH